MLLSSGRRLLLSQRSTVINRAFAGSADRVVELGSNQDFKNLLEDKAVGQVGRLAVIDFTATWCAPCKQMAPIYSSLSTKYPEVSFYKADIDNEKIFESVAAQEVSSVPTFTFHKGGKRLAALTGADPKRLQQLLEEHQ